MIKCPSNTQRNKVPPGHVLPVQWDDAQDDILEFLDRLENTIKSVEMRELSIALNKKMFHINPVDSWRILSNINSSNRTSLCVRNIILDGIKKIEDISGFAGWISLLACLEGMKRNFRHRVVNSYSYSTCDVSEILHHLAVLSQPTNLETLKRMVKKSLQDEFCANLVLDAHELVGADGQIFIHKDLAPDTVVELINGYKFSCSIDPRFIASTKLEKWDRTSPKIFIIDGMIERVSEINRVLEDAVDKKYSGILLCLGFSEEVIATLSVNYMRGSLDILPIAPGPGIENINLTTDVAVVVGSDVISSHKGELISSLDPDVISVVDRVTVDRRGMLIQNSLSKNWAAAHVKHLLERRDEENMDDKVNLINLRLASLTSRYCHVKLGSCLEEELSLIMGRIETGIKLGREVSRFGIISVPEAISNLDDIHTSPIKKIIKSVLQRLYASGHLEISASSLILGIRGGLSCLESVSSAGCFLISD